MVDVSQAQESDLKHMVVLGASSEIAMATLEEFAVHGPWHLSLCGRNLEALEALAASLCVQYGCVCSCHYFDATMDHAAMYQLWEELSSLRVDVFFCAVGYLGPQALSQSDIQAGELIFQCNFNGLVPLIALAGSYFESQGQGQIMVITSVAGDRGRCSNYYYGASKAAMSAYLSGLRVRLYRKGVAVINIKPGYVKTRMVAKRNLPPYISASVQTVAKDIYRAYLKPRAVVYTMWLWRYIMLVVKLLPDFVFKHLHMF